jgi:hypothetical protein
VEAVSGASAADAELHEIAEQSRAAYRRWRELDRQDTTGGSEAVRAATAAYRDWQELDQAQTRKADEIRELERQIREGATG